MKAQRRTNTLMTETREFTLDDVDLAIIKRLVEDPRVSYANLATTADLSAAATKTRLQHLREHKCLTIMGRVDPAVLGYGMFAFAFLEVSGDAHEAAGKLAALPETAFIVIVGGSASLIVELRGRDWRHLARAVKDVRRIPGLHDVKVAVLVAHHKQDWSRLPSGSTDIVGREHQSPLNLDEIDLDIFKVLARDGRASFADISREVLVPQGTARQRTLRLFDAGAVTVQTIVSAGVRGLAGYAAVGLTTTGGSDAVAKQAAELAQVALVATVIGAFDVVVEFGYRDADELGLTFDRLRAIEGVKHLEPFAYLAELKESMDAGLW